MVVAFRAGTADERLRNERFAQGAGKAVDYAANWNPTLKVARDSAEEADLLEIIYAIGKGNLIPERCYRNGIERDRDYLLEDYGIKHFHLGGDNSDTLVFVAEYEEFAVLLDIGSHDAFATKPVGSVLRSLHDSVLRNADKRAAAQREQRIEDQRKIAKTGLLPRRSRD